MRAEGSVLRRRPSKMQYRICPVIYSEKVLQKARKTREKIAEKRSPEKGTKLIGKQKVIPKQS